MPAGPIDQLARAHEGTHRLVSAVADDQWDLPTPCTDWTVRDLVRHLVNGDRAFAAILRAPEPLPLEELRRRQAEDHLGADPVAAYRAAADDLEAACREDGALERTVTVPIGAVPGRVAVQLRIVEALVHGWDLARATGLALDVPDEIVEQSLVFTEAALGRLPADRSPFGPPQPVDAGAPVLDRLAARLGRPVAPEPAGGRP